MSQACPRLAEFLFRKSLSAKGLTTVFRLQIRPFRAGNEREALVFSAANSAYSGGDEREVSNKLNNYRLGEIV